MDYPKGLKPKYRKWWDKPWTAEARRVRNVGFRRNLSKLGYLTTNFTYAEYRCKDGSRVPRGLKTLRARNHCFRLERFRHAVGDVSLPLMSAYRSPSHNRNIGGARKSRHMEGDATDFSKETVNLIGRDRFFQTAEVIFADGGVGDYPAGSAHLDSRGTRARWRSF